VGFTFDFGFGARHPGRYDGLSTRHEYSVTKGTITTTGAISFTGKLGVVEIGKVGIDCHSP
jgi:hypothetical protein